MIAMGVDVFASDARHATEYEKIADQVMRSLLF